MLDLADYNMPYMIVVVNGATLIWPTFNEIGSTSWFWLIKHLLNILLKKTRS